MTAVSSTLPEREAPVFVEALRALPPPEPSMGKEAYAEERRLRLDSDARCRENYERFMRAKREPHLAHLPIKLDIENVSRCNFRCTMCQVSDWPKGRRAKDMTFAQFKGLIDEQYGLVEIKIQGMGEPTMGAPHLFDMIRYARDRHIWVRTITNASLLHLKENYRKLIDSDPNEVQISIDGATKEVFETIRVGSRFEKVAENCKLINRYCREKDVKRTKMWTVVQAGNVHQLWELVDLAAALGFQSMVLSLNLTDWGSPEWTERTNAVTVEDRVSPELAHRLIARGRELGVTVAFWSVVSKYSHEEASTLCPWPFERAYISSDMRVVPCCMIANPDTLEVGSAEKFTDVWFGETMTEFRTAHIEGRIPSACRGCYKS